MTLSLPQLPMEHEHRLLHFQISIEHKVEPQAPVEPEKPKNVETQSAEKVEEVKKKIDTVPAPEIPATVPQIEPSAQEKLMSTIDTNRNGKIDKEESEALMRDAAAKRALLALPANEKRTVLRKMIRDDTSGTLLKKLTDASNNWDSRFTHDFVVSELKKNRLTEEEGGELIRIFRSLDTNNLA